MPGWDEGTKEITRSSPPTAIWLSARTCTAVRRRCPPDDAAAVARSPGGVPTSVLWATSTGRSPPELARELNGRVGTIGYCSGGRQSFLAACSLQLDAAVDCYGAFVVGTPPEAMPLKIGPIVHMTDDLSCPLLGLFGAEDQHPSPAEVAELEEALKRAGKTYEFHSYEGAGHAFFATERPSYRPEAANDGWQRIWSFFGRYLASGE